MLPTAGTSPAMALMAHYSLRDFLRYLFGGTAKKKSAFKSEQEAYEFCLKAYKESGGVSPDLLRAYEFYQKNFHDDGCQQFYGPGEHPRLGAD
jgi:hypothetical protein